MLHCCMVGLIEAGGSSFRVMNSRFHLPRATKLLARLILLLRGIKSLPTPHPVVLLDRCRLRRSLPSAEKRLRSQRTDICSSLCWTERPRNPFFSRAPLYRPVGGTRAASNLLNCHRLAGAEGLARTGIPCRDRFECGLMKRILGACIPPLPFPSSEIPLGLEASFLFFLLLLSFI